MLQITLTDSRGNLFAKVTTFDAANITARAIFRQQKYSDLYYSIVASAWDVKGSIDLEPYSFHARHQKKLFTCHLRTFWSNVAKNTGSYGITPMDSLLASEIVKALPAA